MGFSLVDYAVLLLYLAGITAFGTRFRRAQHTVKDYFVGRGTTSWWIIGLSIVATETSTLTLIGVPALVYGAYARPELGGSLTYLQVVFGYLVGRAIICVLLLPSYFAGETYAPVICEGDVGMFMQPATMAATTSTIKRFITALRESRPQRASRQLLGPRRGPGGQARLPISRGCDAVRVQ